MDNIMNVTLQYPFIDRYPELRDEEKLVRYYLKCALDHEKTKGLIKISRYYNSSFYYAVYGDSLENCKMAISYTDKPVDAFTRLIETYPELSHIAWHLVIAIVIGDHNPHVRDGMYKVALSVHRNKQKILRDQTMIPDFVLKDIEFLERLGKYDMRDIREVITAAGRRKLTETKEWLINNETAYKKKVILEDIEKRKRE
jgi:hypothetical protein